MQQDQFEVLFCDLCGTSVPLTDLERGAAIRHQAKTIGACCLAVLRKGDSPLANPGLPTTADERQLAAPRAAGGEGRLLPVAVFLLAALAAATIYLDQKIESVGAVLRGNHEQVLLAQRSDSDVLQGVGVAMDAMARKTDVDALVERLSGFDRALQQAQDQARLQAEAVRQGLGSLQQEARQQNAGAVDYKPLFEDLRQQLQRMATALADLRAAPVGGALQPRAEDPAGAQPPVAEVPVAPGLPEALVAHVKKLDNTDPAIRFEAVDALIGSKNPAVLKHLLPMARDADLYVRRLTVEGLRDFKQAEAVEQLIAALADSETTVAETAYGSLKKLTGQKIPFDAASPSKDTRLRGQQRWQEWWDKNKATFGS